ncbi:hypothetical protein HSBAA_64560 [Vreelandella sulfidaeris]|uniref:TRAP C4-dicarboxylate transport system permease DctM subunit domain-containing protein n=1 Tax=Vreelandella sulfidaeris TaxID=115553 RepID=A0A455UFZ5_9GAMM|nr:hypothetical protein HSBAA_64560 [Halomonas sulfidaeris]
MAPAADREELMAELGHTSGIGMLLLKGLVPPVVLIVAVLGSILSGFATPTEASAVGRLAPWCWRWLTVNSTGRPLKMCCARRLT